MTHEPNEPTATMQNPTINEHVIESLYNEGLLLADEARAAFDMRAAHDVDAMPASVRLALSVEGLRTTTRLMNVLAWLLNQRAYLSGEMSENQLRRHGTLGKDRPSDPSQLRLLEPATRALIVDSERLYARVARLDSDWRADRVAAAPVQVLRGRIAQAFAAH